MIWEQQHSFNASSNGVFVMAGAAEHSESEASRRCVGSTSQRESRGCIQCSEGKFKMLL